MKTPCITTENRLSAEHNGGVENGTTHEAKNGVSKAAIALNRNRLKALSLYKNGDEAFGPKTLEKAKLPIPITEQQIWESINTDLLSEKDRVVYNALCNRHLRTHESLAEVFQENEKVVEGLE